MTIAPAGTATDDRTARAIARQLIGEDPSEAEISRWQRAVAARCAPLERERDRRLWRLIETRPSWIGIVDAGLALTDSASPIRHRLYLMLAVLEASPAHTRRFLSRDYPRFTLIALAARMALAAARGVCGAVLVRGFSLYDR
jgi:hypothetical protein